MVLALPRGGVPVGFAVAEALGVPLDVFLVRKLGVPGQEELAMGAVASGGVRYINSEVVRELGISPEEIDRVATAEQQELDRRDRLYRDGRPALNAHGKTVILVDDGLATGSTMRAAAKALRLEQPAAIVVAVPVAASVTCDLLRSDQTATEALSGFRRFPAWMWRNTGMLDFVEWLRRYNEALPAGIAKAGFYGLDLYSLHSSIESVLQYLDKVDPQAARRARYR